MPIHTLGNDDTAEKENVNQHENEDDEPNKYEPRPLRASIAPLAIHRHLPLQLVKPMVSPWIYKLISLRIATARAHRKLPRSQLHPVRLRLRLYLRL